MNGFVANYIEASLVRPGRPQLNPNTNPANPTITNAEYTNINVCDKSQ
jgi:hypothetical protein